MKVHRVIFWIHLIGGLIAGSIIMIMAVTGILLAFEPQIVDWAEQRIRYVAVSSDAQRLDVQTLALKARAAKPDGKISAVTVKSDPKSSVVFNFGREGGSLYLDPYTGQTLGTGSKIHDMMHFIEDVHRWLGSKEIGKPITGAACLVFCGLLVSGLYLWWPKSWNWNWVKSGILFNTGLKGKARDWNWHNVFGFWAAPFILITTLTGLIMSYGWANDLLYRASGNTPPPRVEKPADKPKDKSSGGPQKPERSKEMPLPDFDLLLSKAQQQVPEWISINIRSDKSDMTAMIVHKAPWGGPDVRSSLRLQTKTADVIKWEPASEWNLGRKLRFWTKYLHTGQLGGVIGQMLAMMTSVAAVMLVWTGFAMAWRRFIPGKK